MQYTIENLAADIRLHQRGSTTTKINIAHTGGGKENLTLSLANLPAGVTAHFQTNSGTPPYATAFTLTSEQTVRGNYPVKLITTTASGATQEHDLMLEIFNDRIDCARALVGQYTYNHCDNAGEQLEAEIFWELPNGFSINSLWGYEGVLVRINCDNMNITTNMEFADGTKFISSGSILNDNEFQLTVKKTSTAASTKECTFNFKRK